jgi:hypothetical protein
MLTFVVNNDTIKGDRADQPLLQVQPEVSRIRTGVDELVRPGSTGPQQQQCANQE